MPAIALEVSHRIEIANRFMAAIGVHGSRLFRNPQTGCACHFELDRLSRLWFCDARVERRVYLHPRHPWEGFSGGPVQMHFIKAMRGYIIHGYRLNPDYFAPTTPSGKPHAWGYGDDISLICACGQSLGVIARLGAQQLARA